MHNAVRSMGGGSGALHEGGGLYGVLCAAEQDVKKKWSTARRRRKILALLQGKKTHFLRKMYDQDLVRISFALWGGGAHDAATLCNYAPPPHKAKRMRTKMLYADQTRFLPKKSVQS